jgi:hypothetical protein
MVAAPVSAGYFDEEIASLDAGIAARPSGAAIAALQEARKFFVRQKAALTETRCDLSWVWRERRPWDVDGCTRIVAAGYAGGPLPGLPRGAFGDAGIAGRLSWPSKVDTHFGAWTGPVYLWTNGRTYSSAEMFAAVMQDNGVARLIGERTGGDGCGFMVRSDPLVLTHSQLRFRIPDCMRLRANGADEVAGISPDIPLPAREGESARARAARALRLIQQDVSRH